MDREEKGPFLPKVLKASFGHPPSSFAWFDGRAHTRIKESASSARNGKRGRTDGRRRRRLAEKKKKKKKSRAAIFCTMSSSSSLTRVAPAMNALHRLQVFFSNRHVVGRVVRPSDGHVVASASTLEQRKKRLVEGNDGSAETGGDSSSSSSSERRMPFQSTSDKRACRRIGALLAERLKKIPLESIDFDGLRANDSKKNEKYSAKRSRFVSKRRRFGGKLSAVLESLRENGIDINGKNAP